MCLNFCRLFKTESKEHTFSETEEMRSRLEYLQSRLEKTRQLFDMETDPEKSRQSSMKKRRYL